MKQKTALTLCGFLSVLLFVGAGCSFDASTNTSMEKLPEPVQPQTEADMIGTKANVDIDLKVLAPAEKKMVAPGTYEDYSFEKIAFAANGDVILFFHAPWCPTCKALDTNINANLTAIPANTKILKVDYDSSNELKKKYGVTYQHTLVQVDKDGNMITKWSGGNTLASIIAKIQ